MLSWERNPAFQATERTLSQYKIIDVKSREILNQAAFDDLLCGLFAAWAIKAIGRDKYVVFFEPVDADHTLLMVQRRPYDALRPSRKGGLFCENFWQSPSTLQGLQGKLLFNAATAQEAKKAEGLIEEIDLSALDSPAKLRAWVIENTRRDPNRYGWLWGGSANLLKVPPKVVQALLTGEKQTRSLLCEGFEQILCLYLGLQTEASFFSCHLKQSTPVKFSETDIVLCFNHEDSKALKFWTPDCGRELSQEVAQDRVFVLENSSGLTEKEVGEPESRWHPKIINWLALRQVGFEQVRLHLCSLVPLSIDNEAMAFALKNDPQISRFHLEQDLRQSIVNDTWKWDALRQSCGIYCESALRSARELSA